MSLATYVHALGRGPSRSRALTQDEARDAMTQILSGEAAPEAVGALLMLMRYRGECAAEVAGFVEAMRAIVPAWSGPAPAIDWPSYAAGRSRGVPLFVLAAKLVSTAGVPVLLHGWNSHQNPVASVRGGLEHCGIAVASDMGQAAALLQSQRIAYLPLEAMAPKALELVRLREVLGLRSAVNTVLRLLNPGRAAVAVQGVFHPSYRELQSDACALLGQPQLSVIKGGGGEFECHPGKAIEVFGLRDGATWKGRTVAQDTGARRLNSTDMQPADLARLWSGDLRDEFAEAVITATAALALETAGRPEPQALARDLWARRHSPIA